MKAYWDSLTKEQQGELAGKVGSTPGYLRLVIKKPVLCWLKKLSNARQVQLRNLT
jgi:hypothetical protein